MRVFLPGDAGSSETLGVTKQNQWWQILGPHFYATSPSFNGQTVKTTEPETGLFACWIAYRADASQIPKLVKEICDKHIRVVPTRSLAFAPPGRCLMIGTNWLSKAYIQKELKKLEKQ